MCAYNIGVHLFFGGIFMLYDVHYHIDFYESVADSVEFFRTIGRQYDIKKFSMLSVPTHADRTCRIENLKVLTAKDMMKPDTFAYFGLWYDESASADNFLSQLKDAVAQGFDGVKLLEQKPDIRKRIGYGIDNEIYDEFFDYLEENEMPIVLHAADPEESWDITKVSKYALEHGRFYGGEGFLTKDEIYAEVEQRLEKNPKLKLSLAHFYFLSADLTRAARMLDTYENIRFDVTPGKEMFLNFSKNKEAAKSFFIKYQDRIMFGTDVNNAQLDILPYRYEVYDLVLKNLFGNEDFTLWGNNYSPIALPDEVKDKILWKNADIWQGENPKESNKEEIIKEIHKVEKEFDSFIDDDKKIFLEIKEYYGA